MKKFLLFSIICATYMMNAHATVRTASVTGNWNSTTTWGGTVPATNDDVVINSGITVTINVNPNNISNVTINGTLQWDATGTGRTWTVTGSFTINSGGTFNCATPGSATTHALNYNGTSFSNNGTFNMVNGSNKCNVVIGGSATQTFGGSNTLTFNKMTLNNTGGKFQIDYGGGNFTPSEIAPTKFNTSITTNDSLVIKQGLMIGCATNNATITHTVVNLRLGSSTSNITSSVNVFTQVTTITVNTGLILNDATNSAVSLSISGSLTSKNMTQSNAATAMALIGPNCVGGASNSTTTTIGGDWTMTDIFIFVGNTKLFGGTEPKRPNVTVTGNISWASSETHTIDIPFTSSDFLIRTCFFGLFDSQGTHPRIILNGGTVSVPQTFNIAFLVFDAPIQTSSPLGNTTVAQISESAADWLISGNAKVLSGASLAIHSDDTLTVNGSLRIQSNGEVAGSETETDAAGYVPTNGPLLTLGSSGSIYVENISGLGKGVYADSNQNVAFKNRTADINWNLNGISSAGTVEYAAAAGQTITDRTYNHLSTSSSGTKTLANSITVNGALTIGSSTTLANGGFFITAKGSITNNGVHSGVGKIILNGTSNQSLSGTGSDWGNFQIINGLGATCSSNISTSGTIDLSSGILTTSSSAKLSLTSSGNYTGGGILSHVSGPMSKTTTSLSEFIFPIGKGGNFRQVSVTPSSTASTTWTAEYFNSSFSNTTSVLAPITSVSNVLYWTVDRLGLSNASVKLYWGSEAGLSDLNGLTVSRWNGSQWTNTGTASITGTTSSGTVKSPVISSFSPFTLGEANTISTIPIAGSPFCPEAPVNVPFTSTGTFNSGNVYTAQLSNKTGSFSSPTTLGTMSSTANFGTIAGIFPASAKAGTGYLIRVISSNPPVTGADNANLLEVLTCGKPTGITVTNITATTADVNWSVVTCAAKYKLQYRKQGTTAWTSKTPTANTYHITGLLANTTYEYRLQTYCTPSGSTKSKFTSIANFTTTLRLSSNLTEGEEIISLYPNPAADQVELTINSNTDRSGTLKIYNTVGQVMMNDVIILNEGSNHLSLTLTSFPAGIYFVEVEQGGEKMMQKLVKE